MLVNFGAVGDVIIYNDAVYFVTDVQVASELRGGGCGEPHRQVNVTTWTFSRQPWCTDDTYTFGKEHTPGSQRF